MSAISSVVVLASEYKQQSIVLEPPLPIPQKLYRNKINEQEIKPVHGTHDFI
ncbi:MAG: hypothetical protein QF858_00750 [Candidatus Pacebacteria bacterium]|jgi:hypothetical protein|nr:hypothetical protein [Candidatus Paceibacterota bacterium]MDP6659520.1 hypothetical protein [Candidatus Paceibacterota bacterium]